MLAIAKAESRLKNDAQNWNCYYINAKGEKYSTSCKPEDRAKAWSVDCGLFQINVMGNTCPSDLFEVENNLTAAKKILSTQGFNAWYTYRYAVKHNLPI